MLEVSNISFQDENAVPLHMMILSRGSPELDE
jgi:hypothetical protein